jgi:hypothetical protein
MLCPGLVKTHIYASDEIRPDALKAGAKPVNTAFVGQLEQVHQAGMEPEVIAQRTIDAVHGGDKPGQWSAGKLLSAAE